MDLILITGLRGKVGLNLSKVFMENGSVVKPILVDSVYSKYSLPSPSEISDYSSVVVVHSGQPTAPRSRLQRKRYLSATIDLINESKNRKFNFVFISSLSAHDSNRSNYSKEKLMLEELTLSNAGTVLKLGIVSEIEGGYTTKILEIQRLLALFFLDFIISSAPIYFTPVGLLSRVPSILRIEDSRGRTISIFNEGVQTNSDLNFFKKSILRIVVFFFLFLSRCGSGKADAFLSLIDGMRTQN